MDERNKEMDPETSYKVWLSCLLLVFFYHEGNLWLWKEPKKGKCYSVGHFVSLSALEGVLVRVSRKAYIPIPSPCMFWDFAFALVSVWAGKWKSIFESCIAGMWFSNRNFPESEAHRKHKKR